MLVDGFTGVGDDGNGNHDNGDGNFVYRSPIRHKNISSSINYYNYVDIKKGY